MDEDIPKKRRENQGEGFSGKFLGLKRCLKKRKFSGKEPPSYNIQRPVSIPASLRKARWRCLSGPDTVVFDSTDFQSMHLIPILPYHVLLAMLSLLSSRKKP